MTIPQGPLAAAPPRESGRSRTARRIGCLALLSAPPLLLAAMVIAPVWINDHRLARMVDRIQESSLPPGTGFGSFAPQVEVSGDSGDCWYTIRFELSTDRPVPEVLNHYRQARIEDPDGDLGDYEVAGWTPSDEPGTPGDGTSTGVIVDLHGTYDTSTDMRCW
ncbi:hypothetical protein [Nonomuraea indica]|uniref:hypothetical protein n=1 Tax=Nonomuraea indica TaxID=1581193 RepID=UPI000C7992F7|nr:hypothetical protein [Nonomuraea indica]